MRVFKVVKGKVAPLDRPNVDTDAIIPKQFMRSIKRTGYGDFCFDGWRYLDKGDLGMDVSRRPLNMDFPLNWPRYQGASILLTRDNFGCGSSREHAPWALLEYGFRVIIAPSFAEIFCNNCYKNGLLPVTLSEKLVDQLFKSVQGNEGYQLTVSLPDQTIETPQGDRFAFAISEFRKESLLKGLDEIGRTLKQRRQIIDFEKRHQQAFPWLFDR